MLQENQICEELEVYPRLHEILNDDEIRVSLFPVTKKWTYMAHAQVSPLPRPTVSAINMYAELVSQNGQYGEFRKRSETICRNEAARIIGVTPSEVALLGSTSLGLSIVANTLRIKDGDNIIIDADDYVSNVLPWEALRPKGIEIRKVRSYPKGLHIDHIIPLIDSKTRLVAVSWVNHLTGRAIALEDLTIELQKKDVFLCVDAIQGLGVREFPVGAFDFLASDSYKWLLGPCGAGILAIKEKRLYNMDPTIVGWHSLVNDEVPEDEREFKQSAEKFEPGTLNGLGIVGLSRSLKLINSIGISQIAEHVKILIELVYEGIRRLGFDVLGDRTWSPDSGIISFSRVGWDVAAAYKTLEEAGIRTSIKVAPNGLKCLRISPHFYQKKSEIDLLLDILGSL